MRVAIVTGSVFGTAEEIAWQAQDLLSAKGFSVHYRQQWPVDDLLALDPQALLVISSTTGMGELPERLQPLVDALEEHQPDWAGRPAGLIGLGDSGYGDQFCMAADHIEELFELLGLVPLQETLRLDASESVTPEEDAQPWLYSFVEQLQGWQA